jgi:hypothetical protein
MQVNTNATSCKQREAGRTFLVNSKEKATIAIIRDTKNIDAVVIAIFDVELPKNSA